jgi:hypothetical protein
MTTYIVSTRIRSTATFVNVAGANADPTAVVCTVKNPAGTTSTPSVTNSATGIYYADITLDAVGRWLIEWQGTGALIAAGDADVYARASYVDG